MKFAASLSGGTLRRGGNWNHKMVKHCHNNIFWSFHLFITHHLFNFFVNRMSNFCFFFFSSDKIRFVFKSCHLTTAIYGKGLTLWHFQNVIEIKTSEILREVLERFQVLRAFSEVFDFRFSVDLFLILPMILLRQIYYYNRSVILMIIDLSY